MAEITFALASSHSPLLSARPEEFALYGERDSKNTELLDKEGNLASFEELIEQAGPGMAKEIEISVVERRVEAFNRDIDRLAERVADIELDALIMIGDDQQEQYHDDNMPAMLVYWGETIKNAKYKPREGAPAFFNRMLGQYGEDENDRDYPVASDLGLHLIESLIDREFDISHANKLRFDRGECHAFGYLHRRIMRGREIPVVPIALNTYYPPNQPTPNRCFQLGEAIREAVESWDSGARVGIAASGGLSHFVVDEELDRKVLKAIADGDSETLKTLPRAKLNSGTSEIRNWIVTAAAAQNLSTEWQDYVPCYRSLAGTGCGMGFALWS